MIIALVLLAVFVVVTAALVQEGLWSGLVMLVNVLFAATLASAAFGQVVELVKPLVPSYEYLLDFLAIWVIFCVALLGAREITDRITRTKVRLRRPVELCGGPLVAALVGWTMMSFTAATLHMAPVPRSLIPAKGMLFGLSPDRGWIAWARGATARSPFGSAGFRFDPTGDFIDRYAERRGDLEREEGLRVDLQRRPAPAPAPEAAAPAAAAPAAQPASEKAPK
jgi:hypothetical protein